jgi:5-methylcytosine-specific restriction protein B
MNLKDSDDLKEAFSKQIIPLLQEYFYGDYGKISLVLGEGFCKGKKATDVADVFADAEDYDTDPFSEKIIYELKDTVKMKDEEFKEALRLLLKIKAEEPLAQNNE